MTLKVSAIGNCCGARVLSNFDNPVKVVDKELKNIFENYTSIGMFTVILNGTQKRKYHNLLMKYKFKIRDTSGNPNSRSILFIYVRREYRPERLGLTNRRRNVTI